MDPNKKNNDNSNVGDGNSCDPKNTGGRSDGQWSDSGENPTVRLPPGGRATSLIMTAVVDDDDSKDMSYDVSTHNCKSSSPVDSPVIKQTYSSRNEVQAVVPAHGISPTTAVAVLTTKKITGTTNSEHSSPITTSTTSSTSSAAAAVRGRPQRTTMVAEAADQQQQVDPTNNNDHEMKENNVENSTNIDTTAHTSNSGGESGSKVEPMTPITQQRKKIEAEQEKLSVMIEASQMVEHGEEDTIDHEEDVSSLATTGDAEVTAETTNDVQTKESRANESIEKTAAKAPQVSSSNLQQQQDEAEEEKKDTSLSEAVMDLHMDETSKSNNIPSLRTAAAKMDTTDEEPSEASMHEDLLSKQNALVTDSNNTNHSTESIGSKKPVDASGICSLDVVVSQQGHVSDLREGGSVQQDPPVLLNPIEETKPSVVSKNIPSATSGTQEHAESLPKTTMEALKPPADSFIGREVVDLISPVTTEPATDDMESSMSQSQRDMLLANKEKEGFGLLARGESFQRAQQQACLLYTSPSPRD